MTPLQKRLEELKAALNFDVNQGSDVLNSNTKLDNNEYFNSVSDAILPKVPVAEPLPTPQPKSTHQPKSTPQPVPELKKVNPLYTPEEIDAVAKPAPEEEAAAKSEAKLQKMLDEYRVAQGLETNQRRNIGMLTGSNQIAQAIASGYGGKIGDGSTQTDALTKAASDPTENLLKRFKLERENDPNMSRNQMQITQQLDENGNSVDVLVNKLTKEKTVIGRHAYSPYSFMHPETGVPTIIPRQVNGGGGSGTKVGTSNTNTKSSGMSQPKGTTHTPSTQVKEYKISDIQGKPLVYKETVQPIINKFETDMKENRDLATSITNMNHKVGVGSINDSVMLDSGLLGGIQTQAAKMAGQKGTLTDKDLEKFGGAGGLAAWANRFLTGSIGKMTDEDIKFFREFSRIMSEAAAEDIKNMSQMSANRMRQGVEKYLPGFTNENAMKWLSADRVSPVVQGPPANEVIKIRHKASGEVQSVKKDAAAKYLNNTKEFEQVQ